jgi:hypothetical protein
VQWCHTEGARFDDPFFDETIERCLRHPFRLLFQPTTSVAELCAYAETAPTVPIGGLIFHVSRCGSTLVSQMLAAVDGYRVLSEAPPLDHVLRTGHDAVLPATLAALAQSRDEPRRVFVKFDAWTTMELAAVRRRLPDAPWIFLYRDPLEVLESHARRFGAHTVRGVIAPAVFGMTTEEVHDLSPIEYAAMVLARIGEAALAYRHDELVTFVNYRQLPGFVTGELVQRWHLDLDDEALQAMNRVAARDAKNPVLPFDPARPRFRPAEQSAIAGAAEKWLAPVYAALEDARHEQEARRA